HVHGDHPLQSLAAKSSRVGKTPGSILGRHQPKKWLSFRSASTTEHIRRFSDPVLPPREQGFHADFSDLHCQTGRRTTGRVHHHPALTVFVFLIFNPVSIRSVLVAAFLQLLHPINNDPQPEVWNKQ
ncbi:MAG: hypothetical protein ACOZE7_10080, partial [Pseudomonadota bacterium]